MRLAYIEVWDGDDFELPDDVITTIQLIVHHQDARIPDKLGLRIWYAADR